MLTTNLWNEGVPRAELDQRAREARLRLERIDRPALRAAPAYPWLRRLLCRFGFGRYGSEAQDGRTSGRLSDRRPRGMANTGPVSIGWSGSLCRAMRRSRQRHSV
jgi:hypothetical protein